MKPSDALARVLDGDLALDDVPDGLQRAVRNMVDFWSYQKAVWILQSPLGREGRRGRLETVPDHLRPGVEEWVKKLFYRGS